MKPGDLVRIKARLSKRTGLFGIVLHRAPEPFFEILVDVNGTIDLYAPAQLEVVSEAR